MRPFERAILAVTLTAADLDLLAYASLLRDLNVLGDWQPVHVIGAAGRAEIPDFFDKPLPLILSGAREDALLAYAAETKADLILVGHRRHRRGIRSLARRLAMKAPCSVWMAPEGSPPRLLRILSPVDFSDRSALALERAALLAKAAGLEQLGAIHVYFNSIPVSMENQAQKENTRKEVEDRFWLYCARIDLHGVDVDFLPVESPHVAETVIREAEEQNADLIVMETRGRSRSAAVLLGSVTDHVMMESPVPVLALKHFGARLSLLKVLLDKEFQQKESPRFG
jgi:nucleotide-binding universal stress UspA family protein